MNKDLTPQDSTRHVVITGLMGVGKSTTAEALAERLRNQGQAEWQVRDSDVDLETLFGHTGEVVAETLGVDELHRLESAVLLGALASQTPTVISAAAWVVEDPRCREAMQRTADVIVLHIPLEHLPERIAQGSHRRPIDLDAMAKLKGRRSNLFDEVADIQLSALDPTNQLIDTILSSDALSIGTC